MSTFRQQREDSGRREGTQLARKSNADRLSVQAEARPRRDTTDLIRERAYQIFETRNGNGGTGDAMSDWLQAEQELCELSPARVDASESRTRR